MPVWERKILRTYMALVPQHHATKTLRPTLFRDKECWRPRFATQREQQLPQQNKVQA